MKTIISHGRKDQIVIKPDIDNYAKTYFTIFTKRLKDSYIFQSEIIENKLIFSGGIFRFVWNGWDLFNTISSGEVEFISDNSNSFIRHKVSFTEVFIISLLFHIIPIFTFKYLPWWSLSILFGIWFIYAAIYLLSVFRFNSYISETLIEVNKKYETDFITVFEPED